MGTRAAACGARAGVRGAAAGAPAVPCALPRMRAPQTASSLLLLSSVCSRCPFVGGSPRRAMWRRRRANAHCPALHVVRGGPGRLLGTSWLGRTPVAAPLLPRPSLRPEPASSLGACPTRRCRSRRRLAVCGRRIVRHHERAAGGNAARVHCRDLADLGSSAMDFSRRLRFALPFPVAPSLCPAPRVGPRRLPRSRRSRGVALEAAKPRARHRGLRCIEEAAGGRRGSAASAGAGAGRPRWRCCKWLGVRRCFRLRDSPRVAASRSETRGPRRRLHMRRAAAPMRRGRRSAAARAGQLGGGVGATRGPRVALNA